MKSREAYLVKSPAKKAAGFVSDVNIKKGLRVRKKGGSNPSSQVHYVRLSLHEVRFTFLFLFPAGYDTRSRSYPIRSF